MKDIKHEDSGEDLNEQFFSYINDRNLEKIKETIVKIDLEDCLNNDGESAITVVLRLNDLELCDLILNTPDQTKETAFLNLLSNCNTENDFEKNLEEIKTWVNAGASFYAKNTEGQPVLHALFHYRLFNVVSYLIRENLISQDVAMQMDDNGNTALHIFASKYNLDNVTLSEFRIFKFFPSELINMQDKSGRTSLHLCTSKGFCERMIKIGGNLTIKDLSGNTPLHSAFRRGCITLALSLATSEIVNEKNNKGMTPLMLYLEVSNECGAGDIKLIVEYLKSTYGCNIEAIDFFGNTALLFCAQNGYLNSLQALVECGANKEVINYNGFNWLHNAIFYNQISIVEYIFKNKAGLDIGFINNPEQFNLPTGANIISLISTMSMRITLKNFMLNGVLENQGLNLKDAPEESINKAKKEVDTIWDGYLNVKDCYQILSAYWSYSLEDISSSTVNEPKSIKKGYQKGVREKILEKIESNEGFLCNLNFEKPSGLNETENSLFDNIVVHFSKIYFVNSKHLEFYPEVLDKECSEFTGKVLQLPLMQEFFKKLGDKTCTILFSPFGNNLSYLVIEGEPKGWYTGDDKDSIIWVAIENQDGLIGTIIHELGHYLVHKKLNQKTLAPLNEFLEKILSVQQLPNITPVEAYCSYLIENIKIYSPEKQLEEFFVRIFQIMAKFGQDGLDYIINNCGLNQEQLSIEGVLINLLQKGMQEQLIEEKNETEDYLLSNLISEFHIFKVNSKEEKIKQDDNLTIGLRLGDITVK